MNEIQKNELNKLKRLLLENKLTTHNKNRLILFIETLEQENKQLKKQLQEKEDIINKVREYCDFGVREWITDDGFVEEVLKDVKEILDNKGE